MSDNERSSGLPMTAGLPSDPTGEMRELSAITRRVVVWYAASASAWIVASDLAAGVARNEDLTDRFDEIAKGLVFVVVTTAILGVVLARLTRTYDRSFARTVQAQRDFYQSILHTSSDVVLIFDAGGVVRYASAAVTEVLGWAPDDLVGMSGQDLLNPADRTAAATFREHAARRGRNRRTFQLRGQDGAYRTLEISVAAITLPGGAPGAVVNGHDVTARDRGEQRLRAAFAEGVQGLPTLNMFVAEMERLGTVRTQGFAVVAVLVDVDRFGDINALHGRVGGDTVLLELNRRLESTLPDAIGLWRHGADELLAVLLHDHRQGHGSSEADLTDLVERIKSAAEEPIALDDGERRLPISVAVGLARLPLGADPGGDALSSQLLRAVEHALVEAKQHPDRIAVHLEELASTSGDRTREVGELRAAVERGEMVVHYQPKVRLADLAVVGAEALVRWEHPERGLLLPGEFLGSIDQANLTATVTRGVLRDALACVPAWLATPGCDPDFLLCVNISLDDLRRKRFADDVLAVVADSGVPPRHLCLELTEQTMSADALGAREVLDGIRRAGIQVAIDDFGTGYSSLEHIRIFEVDALKIDKGFVQRIGQSHADEAIVDSIIAIGQRLGVNVTAEGIEDAAALAYLRERRCNRGQGFLFSPAVPVDAFDPAASYAGVC